MGSLNKLHFILQLFFLTACTHLSETASEVKEWYTGPKMIKIQAEDANQDLNKALFAANQKAIQKVQERGCETKIGESETYYRRTGSGWIATAIYRVPVKKCQQEDLKPCTDDWTKETSRSQGGGWVWFPGLGVHASLSRAILAAEGTSLNYLYGECQSIPNETKFNERCITRENQKYKVHVRASIRQNSCDPSSASNKELVSRLLSYRAIETKHALDTSKCNETNAEGCFLLAHKEKELKNLELSLAYSEAGCLYKDYYSCGFLGFLHWELGNAPEARKYLKLGCKHDSKNGWCENLKELEDQISKL